VWFEDEAFFGRMSNPVPCWAPRKVRPALPLQRQRQYRNVYGAVCPASGGVFQQTAPRNNTELMGGFLSGLSASRGGARMVVFMDGAGWHTSKDLVIPANMRLEILPAHSPELNPAEQLWKHIRAHHTHNQAWTSLEDVDASLAEAFKSLAANPKTVQSFSLFSWMVYK
jgi:transposase